MLKTCDNCYWKGYKNKWCFYQEKMPKEYICNEHNFICQRCDSTDADYNFKGEYVCSECLLKEFEVEESTTTHYYLQGEYIGSDDDMDEVILNLDDSIKRLCD